MNVPFGVRPFLPGSVDEPFSYQRSSIPTPTRPCRAATSRSPCPAHAVLGRRSRRRSRRHRLRAVRHGLLLGRRADVLADAGRVHDRGRLRRRPHAQPHLRRGLLGQTGHAEVVLVVYDPTRSATTSCSRSSGRATIPPRACGRATTPARSTARRSTAHAPSSSAAAEASARRVPAGADEPPARRDHDRDRATRRTVLLRRGLPPAVPAQESERLLRHRRHRCLLPDRRRRHRRLTYGRRNNGV